MKVEIVILKTSPDSSDHAPINDRFQVRSGYEVAQINGDLRVDFDCNSFSVMINE